MWILIWSIWFNKSEVVTRQEYSSPYKSAKDCREIGDFKSKNADRIVFKITYRCKYIPKAEFERIKKDLQDRARWD